MALTARVVAAEVVTAAFRPQSRNGGALEMTVVNRQPTGQERTFPEDEIIVSKTDPRGRLTYVNDVFLNVTGFSEGELIGQPHSIVRHPDMPRCIFKLLWTKILEGREIFAYINNLAKNGDNYWVFAHVTPNFAKDDTIVGFHSNRRVARRDALQVISPIYAELLAEERRHNDCKEGLAASYRMLMAHLEQERRDYDEFVLGL